VSGGSEYSKALSVADLNERMAQRWQQIHWIAVISLCKFADQTENSTNKV
jgi:hypothetical protein